MLRLRHQVTPNENWITLVADEHGFSRTSEEINGTIERNKFLGCRHEPIAGTDNLVHEGDALRSIGKCSDGLSPANAVELVHAEKRGNSQSLPRWMRRHHANQRHTRDLGRYHSH